MLLTPTSTSSCQLSWTDEHGATRCVSLEKGNSWILGRDPECDIPIGSPDISWHHAQLERNSNGWTLRDLNATNGTRLETLPLRPNQAVDVNVPCTFSLGKCELRLTASLSASGRTEVLPALASSSVITIGRAPECDVVVDSPLVSRRHTRLTREQDGWLVEDLGSANGTFINGLRIDHAHWKKGERLQVGEQRFRLGEGALVENAGSGHLQLEARDLWKIASNGMALLRGVSFSIAPGEMVAIAGASGAGKSTLLKALNGTSRATRGQVCLGGFDLYKQGDALRSSLGYVPQDDIVHLDLTVSQALRFAARLRLPDDTSESEISAIITRTLNELEIARRANAPIRSLSGGERKRVNIAVELLSRPSVLFLDEPTTGLDAGLERRVTELLRALAGEGRTIVVVTHAATTLDSFDKVAFLARGGRLAFFGTPRAALSHFGVRDFSQIYQILDGEPPAFANSPAPTAQNAIPSAAPVHRRASALSQTNTLLQRYGAVVRADTRNLTFLGLQVPIVIGLMTLLFQHGTFAWPQSPTANGDFPMHDAPRLLLLMTFALVCLGLCNSAREIVKERAIYERERHVALRIGPYLISKAVLLSGIAALQTIISIAIVSAKVPLHLNGSSGLTLFALLFLGALNALLLGLLISALSSSPDQSVTLVAGVLLIQVLLSGLVPLAQLPDWLRPVASLCAVRWSYGGLCGVFKISDRWPELGLEKAVDTVMQTKPTQAVWVLLLLAGLTFAMTWGALEWKERTRH